jgi:diketogulonate reductase-like aldo/keto reductase
MAEVTPARGTLPRIIYGTAWKEERTERLTTLALELGFTGIDTANQRKHYYEAAVGEAIAAAIGDGLVTRGELFLQTKFTSVDGQDHRLPYERGAPFAEQVAQSFASSLEHLGTDYVDSYVLHGPSQSIGLGDEDWQVWGAMSALQRANKTRRLGVSNVNRAQLEALWRGAEVKPAFVQNRCYARTGWDRQTRAFCREHGIAYQGFSLLTANRRELDGPVVRAVAKRLGRTVPQVIFAFALELGMLPLTGSSSAAHLAEDLTAFDIMLGDDEVRAIEAVSG